MEDDFDIERLQQDAQNRWLKPAEVFFILHNHEKYTITKQTPHRPSSGSLFLFNRRVNRFFRKDGYTWRKKKDGRTGEGHERLKVHSVDALNCYYAHGEPNPFFQRRSYWMLNKAYEHIVLVHYREVFEGRCISGSIDSPPPSGFTQSISFNNTQDVGPTAGNNLTCVPHNHNSSSPGYVEMNPELVENKNLDCLVLDGGSGKSTVSSDSNINEELHKLKLQLSLDDDEAVEFYTPEQEEEFEHVTLEHGLHDSALDNCFQQDQSSGDPSAHDSYLQQDESSGYPSALDSYFQEPVRQDVSSGDPPQRNSGDNFKQQCQFFPSEYDIQRSESISCTDMPDFLTIQDASTNGIALTLNGSQLSKSTQPEKLDSHFQYGKNEFSQFQCSASNSGQEFPKEAAQCSTTTTSMLNNENYVYQKIPCLQDYTCSSDHPGFQHDQNSNTSYFGTKPAMLGKARFRINEVSPEWAFSTESTKVIIAGDFLSASSEHSLAVMFGDTEVPSDIIQDGVLRCHAPKHPPGRVRLCITSGNREACSEVKEFEYIVKPEITSSSNPPGPSHMNETKSRQELSLLQSFTQILLFDSAPLQGVIANSEINLFKKLKENNGNDIKDCLLQELLKDKLKFWLSSKHPKSDDTSNCSLSKQEQCLIHIVSGLGYEWALNPLLDSGVGINFRDANGWTALHWAAKFGREKMVAALLAAGASPGAVTDPTSQDPLGQTAASISESSGYKGLSGYLSEVALTAHLSSLTMGESEDSVESAAAEAEKVVEGISKRTADLSAYGTDKQFLLEDSLAAVRNSALTAARIQAAFRSHSLRKRQQMENANHDEFNFTPKDIGYVIDSLNCPKNGHGSQQKCQAALSIQKKFRGWKGRRKFLTIRQNVVKIQAHVRGYQVRKKYKEILWSVGVMEKVVLRWRRKRVGLRGFNLDPMETDDTQEDDILKRFRKIKVDAALKKSVSRVLSMSKSLNARQQYCRTRDSYFQAKAELDSALASLSTSIEDIENIDQDTLLMKLEEWLNSE